MIKQLQHVRAYGIADTSVVVCQNVPSVEGVRVALLANQMERELLAGIDAGRLELQPVFCGGRLLSVDICRVKQ